MLSIRSSRLAALVLAALSASAATSRSGEAGPRRPNVVILLADDLGYTDIGVQGCKDIPTPHIDTIARDGARCTSGYVSCPVCSPTRAALLTGRYQQRFGYEFNPTLLRLGGAGQGLPRDQVTLARRLQDAGYATGLIGKWHLGEEEKFHPLEHGFQEFFGFLPGAHDYFRTDDRNYGPLYRGRKRVDLTGYLTRVLAQEAVAFIDRHAEEPFFLYLAFNAVHVPMQAPEPTLRRFAAIEPPTRRTYAAMTAELDDAVGRVLDKLRAAGLEENTLVFFLSDNGGPIGKLGRNGALNTPLRGSKGDTWEGGVRVAFLMRWKGQIPSGKVYKPPVIQLDIHATALAAAGVDVKPEWKLDGVNLLSFLSGKRAGDPHTALYWRFGEQMAIRRGDWKLVQSDLAPDRPFGDIAERPMLFHLGDDMAEEHDLAAAHPDRVKEMYEVWRKWNDGLMPPRWREYPPPKPRKGP
jgi:arylsulfatase A-like enzyme